jgi:Mitochondrial carrier protein
LQLLLKTKSLLTGLKDKVNQFNLACQNLTLLMASPKKTKRRVKLPMNYQLTPPKKQSFELDKFESSRVKSENKSSENHLVTTTQLATTLAGIWSYIGQPAALKSDENLNYEICQKEAVQCKNQISTCEQLKAMKKKMFFSYYKLASIDVLWNKGKHMEFHYMGATYDPKYLHSTRSSCNARNKFYTVETTEDPGYATVGGDTRPMQEAMSQRKEETMLMLENKDSDQESENKFELLTATSCVNTKKELLGNSSSTVAKLTADKSIGKSYGGRSDSLQEYFTRCHFSVQDQVKGAIYVNRHALAGALAGTMVSLCLHPVDTVKTIIQSSATGGYSFCHVLRQTLIQRGMV